MATLPFAFTSSIRQAPVPMVPERTSSEARLAVIGKAVLIDPNEVLAFTV
jgi:hypothetical protein